MSWKTPITLLVLLGVLLGAAFYGWQTIISPATGSDSQNSGGGTAKCKKHEFHKGQKIMAKDFIVNVYNAGAISGLAGHTLNTLHANGFVKGVSDNAPAGVGATNVTILTKDQRLPQVRLVASQFRGRVLFRKGIPLAPGIDVIVGDNFAGMNQDAQNFLQLKHLVRTCTSVASASG